MVIPSGSNNIGSMASDATVKSRQSPVNTASSKTKNTNDESASKTDNVSISLAGKAMAKVEAILAEAPDVDMNKVAQVRNSIADGSYKINDDLIAAKMLAQDSSLPQA